MSIIRRQASNQVLINYVGTIISAIATIAIFPLELEAYGLAQFILSTAMLMVPFATLGTITAVVKFFPEQKDGPGGKSYLLNMLIIHGGGLILFFLLFFLFRETFYDLLAGLQLDARKVKFYSFHLMIASFLVVLNRVLILHASNHKKIAVPAIYNMLLPKVALPILILVRHSGLIGDYKFLWLWIGTYLISAIGLTVYLRRIGGLDLQWNFTMLSRNFVKRVMTYASFTGLGAMATMLANRVDIIMITLMLGERQTGVYTITLFIANVLAIPSSAIWQITSPVVADAWEHDDRDKIRELYQRTSINLLIFGVLMYFLTLGSLDAIYSLTPKYETLSAGIMVFVFLGMAKIVDMMMGINHQIIVYSKLYKYNIIFDLTLGIGNTILNYIFIQRYGIVGAAMATCISVSVYHLLKMLFIWMAFGMLPFSIETLKVVAMAAIALAVYWFVPVLDHPILHILTYCSILTIVYYLSMRFLKLNNDVVPFLVDRWTAFRSKGKGV